MTQLSGQTRSTEQDHEPPGPHEGDRPERDVLRVVRLRRTDEDDRGHVEHRYVLLPSEVQGLDGADAVEVAAVRVSALHRVARTMPGTVRLRLPDGPTAAVDPGLARYWASAAAHARAAASVAGADDDSIVRTTAEDSLAAATIAAFALAPLEPGAGDTPLAVRRAIAFMEAHAAEPITITDVAAAAHMSVRGLQSAFRRAIGSTPLEYLRAFRLQSAHEDLVAADPSRGDSVGGIASRWGLMHAGRFSQRYREVFGESPMTTLHR